MRTTQAPDSLEQLRERFVSSAYLQHHPFFAVSAEGSWITGLSGARYLDLTGGIAVLNVGHRHPAVMASIAEQSERLLHIGPVALQEGYVRLAAAIAERVPGPKKGSRCCSSTAGRRRSRTR